MSEVVGHPPLLKSSGIHQQCNPAIAELGTQGAGRAMIGGLLRCFGSHQVSNPWDADAYLVVSQVARANTASLLWLPIEGTRHT
jgi:hypothetical protein